MRSSSWAGACGGVVGVDEDEAAAEEGDAPL